MITKEAENKSSNLRNFFLSNSARSSFSHILSCLFQGDERKILMPAYIGETNKEGSGVFDPVRKNGIKYGFYQVKENLSARIDDIENQLRSGEFKALLIIHYFGFVQNDLKIIIALCKKYDVIFIEDCAHSFHSKFEDRNIGEWGDVAFFSIHKSIPTSDGGFGLCERKY
jgi:aspartate aminotransferase-like enzyme